MNCYQLDYSHRCGKAKGPVKRFVASKWADTPEQAEAKIKAAHDDAVLERAVGPITYGKARLVCPQPFGGETNGCGELDLGAAPTAFEAGRPGNTDGLWLFDAGKRAAA